MPLELTWDFGAPLLSAVIAWSSSPLPILYAGAMVSCASKPVSLRLISSLNPTTTARVSSMTISARATPVMAMATPVRPLAPFDRRSRRDIR